MQEVYEFLKKCGVFYIATIDNDKPRVRPFGALNIFEDKLYLQTAKSKNVFKQIELNNHVEICGFSEGKWIRIETELVVDDRDEAKINMLENNPELKSMYSVDDNNKVLYMKNSKATIYSFTEAPKTIEF